MELWKDSEIRCEYPNLFVGMPAVMPFFAVAKALESAESMAPRPYSRPYPWPHL
jgi:hypothetical protein